MRERTRVERAIIAVAERQHGVVTRAQLVAAGLSRDMVDRRLARGQLRQLHRGVYLLGPILAPLGDEMAAVLACGKRAVVSQRSAAGLWQLLPVVKGSPVDVSVQGMNRRRHPGIRMHRVQSLPRQDTTKLDGVPVTAVARTLFDIAGAVSARQLEQALAAALDRRLATRGALVSRLRRQGPRRGTALLRAMLQAGAGPALTRSEAEERFLALVLRAGLPKPSTNVKVGSHEVDFLWPAERLVVEVDGHAFHSSERSFESDRRRDSELVASGLRVVRVTWRQLVSEPEALLVRLAQALGRDFGMTAVSAPDRRARLAQGFA